MRLVSHSFLAEVARRARRAQCATPAHAFLRGSVAGLLRGSLAVLTLALLGAALASAQSAPFDFTLLVSSQGSTVKVPNGQSITINTEVGTKASVTVIAQYTGTTSATITALPTTWLIGSTEFMVTVPSTVMFPLVLNPGDSLTFTATYAPTMDSQANAQLSIPYTEPGSNNTSIVNSINLSFVGTSPSFTLSYVLQVDNNVVQIPPGGTLLFLPPTQLNTTANANLNITNTGSGSGTVTALSLTSGGPVFKLTGTPLLPYTLAAGQTLQVGISYTPAAVENDTGAVKITFQDGTTDTVNLSGSGATSTYTYTVLSSGTKMMVQPNGTITLPSVTLATSGTTSATSQVIVTVTNSGNANGTINSVNITAPFSLSGLPATPPVLKPGDSESFTITYTPTAIGMQTGTLVVGNDTFKLVATGLGPQLTFTYSNGIPVGSGAVVFPLIPVSQSENVSVTVTNSGTSTAAISLISVGPNPPFSVPALSPSSLAAGQSITFPITFTPTTVGSINGTLIVNSTSVPLIGAGSAPPSFPSYTLAGPSGNVAPATQQSVSLTLAHSYPVDVNGVLTLTTAGNLGTDPNVQFSSGGRTVAFTIPADSTSADFAGQGSQILLQTGTVAETVTLTPSFATTAGVNLTPASPNTLEFAIPALAPVLTSLQTTNQTTSGFTLLVEGYATTKSLDSLLVSFTPAPGYNLAVSQITINLTQIASLWFQSASSLSFGGTFEISIPFNLSGTVGKTTTLLQTIASVSATVSNSTGTSNSLELVSP